MGIGFAIGRFIERLITLVIVAALGAFVGFVLSQDADGALAGAILAGLLVLLVRIIRAGIRARARRAGAGEIGTLLDIIKEPPPGAPWYHHTHVLIDIKGKRHKLKLTPEQAKTFSERFAIGDVGRVVVSGKGLADFVPATPAAPVREKTGLKIFVSYAHGRDQESQMAEYVAEVLETAGLDPWLDKSEVRPGKKLREELVTQIRHADFFVPLLSPEYMTSEWCLKEFEAAAEAGIPMRPVKISEGRLVPPPYLRKLYEQKAGEPVYLDMTSHHAPQKLRELADDMVQSASKRRSGS
jgi:hypothetical protein